MRLASVLWLSILKVVIICSLVLTLISWTFLEACTIEIWPIVSVVPSAHFIVVGTVDSIRPEVTYRDEESDIGVRELVSTIIQVERVLKGDLEPGPLVLSFSEGISHSGCNFLLEPYKVDNRLLLMITEEDEGSYFSPLVPPRVIVLGEDSSALAVDVVEFVEYTIAHGTPPIQIEFHSSDHFSLSGYVNVSLKVTNHMANSVTVLSVPENQAHPLPSGILIWFDLRDRIGDSVQSISGKTDSLPKFVTIAPNQTERISLPLTDTYQLTEPGHYHFHVKTQLSTSKEGIYVDFRPYAFSFLLEESTGVSGTTWGQIKRVSAVAP